MGMEKGVKYNLYNFLPSKLELPFSNIKKSIRGAGLGKRIGVSVLDIFGGGMVLGFELRALHL
jgi:hypothetical protein